MQSALINFDKWQARCKVSLKQNTPSAKVITDQGKEFLNKQRQINPLQLWIFVHAKGSQGAQQVLNPRNFGQCAVNIFTHGFRLTLAIIDFEKRQSRFDRINRISHLVADARKDIPHVVHHVDSFGN